MERCTGTRPAMGAVRRDLRVACDRGSIASVVLVALVSILAACGGPQGSAAAELQLPVVGTVGRAPEGESVIRVVVDADGRISVDGEGPLSLAALGSVLERHTRDLRWHADDATSRRLLLIDADARVPWVVPYWVICVGVQSRAPLWRCFFGARARGTNAAEPGTRGALACYLNGDQRVEYPDVGPESPRLEVLLGTHEGEAADPEGILPALRARMAEAPDLEAWLELKLLHLGGQWIRTGFVVQLLALALAEGVKHVELSAPHLPSVGGKDYPGQPAFDPADVDALLAYVAKLKTSTRQPTLGIVDVLASALHHSPKPPPARGRLDVLFGAGLLPGETEPRPRSVEGLPQRTDPGDAAFGTEEVLQADVEDIAEQELAAEVPVERDDVQSASDVHGIYRHVQRRRRSDHAVDVALGWLESHQLPSGGWASQAVPAGDVRSTGWALLAFLSAGYTDRAKHRFADVVRRGFAWLEERRASDGFLGDRRAQDALLGHAAATLACVQLQRFTGRLRYHSLTERTLTQTLSWHESAAARTAGFDTTLHMALPVIAAWWATREATEQGLPEPLVPIARIESVLQGLPDRLRAPSNEAQIAARAWLLGILDDPVHAEELALLRASLVRRVPSWDVPASGTDPALWWFGSLALFQAADTSWDVFKERMHARGLASQAGGVDLTALSGSWAPADDAAHGFDRTQTTALMAFAYALLFRCDRVFGSE
ncbi:MAG: hypothetical protein AB7T63_13565 [Planctomycetota bacterium]